MIVSRWADPSEADANVAWARATSDAAKPFTNGRVYVNYIGAGEAPDRVRAAFSPEKFARLVDQAEVRSDERVPDESEHLLVKTRGQVAVPGAWYLALKRWRVFDAPRDPVVT